MDGWQDLKKDPRPSQITKNMSKQALGVLPLPLTHSHHGHSKRKKCDRKVEGQGESGGTVEGRTRRSKNRRKKGAEKVVICSATHLIAAAAALASLISHDRAEKA